jgi:hypothetical protein
VWCSGDEHHGSGEGCDGVDMTIGYDNWKTIGMATILALLGASEMLRKRCGDAAEVSLLLLLLGAKQGQNVYLAGQLLPSFLSNHMRSFQPHML